MILFFLRFSFGFFGSYSKKVNIFFCLGRFLIYRGGWDFVIRLDFIEELREFVVSLWVYY